MDEGKHESVDLAEEIAKHESVDITEVISEQAGNMEEPTGLQKAGLELARLILWAILALLVVVGADWIIGGPTMPSVPTGSDQTVIENYAALRDADLERPRQLFMLVVSGGLLPIFTLLLGYIFGSRDASN